MITKNTHVLVTGASRGLGRALSEQFAARGARVSLVARATDELDRAALAVAARGGEALSIAADVADKEQTHRVVGAATAAFGPVDVLVHAASTLGPTPLVPLLDTECEDLSRAFDVNLVGAFRLTKAIVGSMALRRRGTVLFITSDASVEAYENWGAYGASKAATDHLARIWAREVRDLGVTIASIDPGEMDTAMHRAAMPDADPTTLARPSDVAAVIVGALVAGRLATGSRSVAAALGVSS